MRVQGVRRFVGAVVALFLFVAAASYWDSLKRRDGEAAALQQGKLYREMYASEAARDSVASGEIAALRAAANRADSAAAALSVEIVRSKTGLRAIPTPAETDSTNPAWRRKYRQAVVVIEGQDAKIAEQAVTITKLDAAYLNDSTQRERWKLLATRGDTTIRNLGAVVEQRQRGCRVLVVVPCPSRKTAFVLGAAATVLVIKRGQLAKF